MTIIDHRTMTRMHLACVLVLALSGLCAHTRAAAATDQNTSLLNHGDELLTQSIVEFSKGNNTAHIKLAGDALQAYTGAEKTGMTPLDAIFGEANALLEMGEYRRAIEKAKYLYSKHYQASSPNLDYVYGSALVHASFPGTPKDREGAKLLKDYLQAAEAHGNESPYVFTKQALAILQKAEDRVAPNYARPTSATASKPSAGKGDQPLQNAALPFNVAFQSGIGFNDNFTSLARRLTLPSTSPRKAILQSESTFGLGKVFSFTPNKLKDSLNIAYLYQADEYDEYSARDQMQSLLTIGYTKSLSSQLSATVKASDVLTYVDQKLSSNRATLQAAFRFSPVAPLVTQVSYFLGRSDGYADSTPLTDPDGFLHKVEFEQDVDLISDRFDFSKILGFQFTYSHQWTETKGAETKRGTNDVLAKLNWVILHRYEGDKTSFFRSISLSGVEEWTPDRYWHDTYPAETALNRYALTQHTNAFTLELLIEMLYDKNVPSTKSRLEADLRYVHTDRDANVVAKAYDQNMAFFLLKLSF